MRQTSLVNIANDRSFTPRALSDAAGASVVPAAIIIAILYGLLTVLHPLLLAGPHRWIIAVIAAVSALASAATAIVWYRQPLRFNPHYVIALIAAIVTANTVVHFALFPSGQHTSNFIALSLGLGLVVLSRPWYWTFQVLALSGWLGVLSTDAVVELGNWGWLYFFAFFVSLVLHEQRIHATKAVARREALLWRRNRLLQKLVNADEWESLNLSAMLSTICRTANAELGADATSIWLIENANEEVRRVMTDVVSARQSEFFSQPDTISMALAKPALDALTEERVVSVGNIKGEQAATQKLGDHIVSSFKTTSLLLSAVVVSGEMVGIVVHAFLGRVHDWSIEDRAFSSSIADISALALHTHERALLEARTHQAERLESLGVLAGGVAHDFNNLLTVIIGNAELLQITLERTHSEEVAKAGAILQAAARAKELATQMLAYAGRASFATKTIDFNVLVNEIATQIGPVLLRRQKLDTSALCDQPLVISVDTTQIRQVLMNLLTNARDANATEVRISSGQTHLQESPAHSISSNDVIAPGEYCWLEISDDGEGMDSQIMQRIFDPFFSTRAEGTGLGLAAVLGIMRAHSGTITVQSTLGEGCTFTLYIPLSRPGLGHVNEDDEAPADPVQGNVLLVDDEPMLSEYAATALDQLDCETTVFHGYEEFSRQLPNLDVRRLDIALLDLTLGDGSGTEIAYDLRRLRPDIPIIIMSGYDASDALSGFALRESVAFLQKPFQQPDLLRAWHLAVSLARR